MVGSRAISAIWLVANWVTATCVRVDAGFGEDHLQQGDVCLCSADDADASSGEFVKAVDFGGRLFLRALGRKAGWRPEHDHVLCAGWRLDSAFAGRFKSPRATARSAFEAANSAMLSVAPSVVIGVRRTGLPSRVVRSARASGPASGRRCRAGRPQSAGWSAAATDTLSRQPRRTGRCPRQGSAARSSFASAACGRCRDFRFRLTSYCHFTRKQGAWGSKTTLRLHDVTRMKYPWPNVRS